MMNNKAIELLKEVLELLEPEEVKLTLDEIVSSGMVGMAEAVEAVIARHELEIYMCEINIRLGLNLPASELSVRMISSPASMAGE